MAKMFLRKGEQSSVIALAVVLAWAVGVAVDDVRVVACVVVDLKSVV